MSERCEVSSEVMKRSRGSRGGDGGDGGGGGRKVGEGRGRMQKLEYCMCEEL